MTTLPIRVLAVLLLTAALALAIVLDLSVGWNMSLVIATMGLALATVVYDWSARRRAVGAIASERLGHARALARRHQLATEELRRLADEIYLAAELWLRVETELAPGLASATALKPALGHIQARIRRIEGWTAALQALELQGIVSARLATAHQILTIALGRLALAYVRQHKSFRASADALELMRIGSREWKDTLASLGALAAMREAAEVKQSCGDLVNALGDEWEASALPGAARS
jgi:hypothetical protein